jgi:hypothetical protein
MIEPLSWESRDESKDNPFVQASTRPLKITLHESSFSTLSADQLAAVALLKELAVLEDLDVLSTAPDASYRVTITRDSRRDHYDVTQWKGAEWAGSTGVSHPQQQLTTAQSLAGSHEPSHADVKAALDDVLIAEAHVSMRRDVLVTESSWIHSPRWRGMARRANPRSILETIKIVGLLLRSRDKYVLIPKPQSMFAPGSVSRALFYIVLSRQLTPHMWRYQSACEAFAKQYSGEMREWVGAFLRVVNTRFRREIRLARPSTHRIPIGPATTRAIISTT